MRGGTNFRVRLAMADRPPFRLVRNARTAFSAATQPIDIQQLYTCIPASAKSARDPNRTLSSNWYHSAPVGRMRRADVALTESSNRGTGRVLWLRAADALRAWLNDHSDNSRAQRAAGAAFVI